jgi:hypothetical protein
VRAERAEAERLASREVWQTATGRRERTTRGVGLAAGFNEASNIALERPAGSHSLGAAAQRAVRARFVSFAHTIAADIITALVGGTIAQWADG